MSQGMVGADIEQLQTLGVTLQAQAAEVRSIADLINRYLPGAPWTGYKADVFRQQWWPQHQAQLRSIADGLHGLGQSALNNADEQRRTSDVRGFAGSAAVSAGGGSGAGSVFGPYYDRLKDGAATVGLMVGMTGLIDLARGFRNAPGPFDLLTVPFDVIDVTQAVLDGDLRAGIPGGSSLILTGIGAAIAPAAAAGGMVVAAPVVAAGAVGAAVINTVFQPDHTVNSYIERTYGSGDDMTVAQAGEYARRYDGWSGFGHYVADGTHGFARTTGGNVKDLWTSFF